MSKIKHIIYVNEKHIPYATALVSGYKKTETRTKNVLDKFAGEKVIIARTKKGKPTEMVGIVVFKKGYKLYYNDFRTMENYNKHLVPEGSQFDCKADGFKWCYDVEYFHKCDKPLPMPTNIKRHGFTFAEIVE